MTTDELITRARRALDTGQPNLARLYMRNAAVQVDAERRKLNPLGWQGRQIREAFRGVGEVLATAGEGLRQVIESIIRGIEATERKSDFALVADNESGGASHG